MYVQCTIVHAYRVLWGRYRLCFRGGGGGVPRESSIRWWNGTVNGHTVPCGKGHLRIRVWHDIGDGYVCTPVCRPKCIKTTWPFSCRPIERGSQSPLVKVSCPNGPGRLADKDSSNLKTSWNFQKIVTFDSGHLQSGSHIGTRTKTDYLLIAIIFLDQSSSYVQNYVLHESASFGQVYHRGRGSGYCLCTFLAKVAITYESCSTRMFKPVLWQP